MPDKEPPPKNKPLGPQQRQGFGLNEAYAAPTPPPGPGMEGKHPPPLQEVNPAAEPSPSGAPTPSPTAGGANFDIMELLRGVGALPPSPDRAAQESVSGYRAQNGPTLSPPYAAELPGYGVRQFTTDQQYPYYVKPEKGVKPQPATSYGTPY